MKQHFGGGKTGINLNPQGLGLFAQPAANITKADNIIAIIVHLRRGGQFACPRFAQHQELVFGGGNIQGGAAVLPVGEKLVYRAGFNNCPRQGMGANFGTLFHHANRDFLFLFLGELH